MTNQLGGLRTYELEGPDSESRGLYLAVSRAFGDSELKGSDTSKLICADPVCTALILSSATRVEI
eukprot:SAG31_NODE_49_length_30599_cov_15.615016_18_plen_65_part_00